MTQTARWQDIVASSLAWEEAHAGLDRALAGLAPALRGQRPANFPHSIWELVDHITRTQRDLLEFCANPKYHEPKWPDDYWPPNPSPTDQEWEQSIATFHRERDAFAAFTKEEGRDLTAKISHGTGQTYLRTVLVSMDHTSHHVGQIIAVRRMLGAWP
jgi:uncharacterized damage-inducible protein DinB